MSKSSSSDDGKSIISKVDASSTDGSQDKKKSKPKSAVTQSAIATKPKPKSSDGTKSKESKSKDKKEKSTDKKEKSMDKKEKSMDKKEKSMDKKEKSMDKSAAKSQEKSKQKDSHGHGRSKSKDSKKSAEDRKSKKAKSADGSSVGSSQKAKPKGGHKKKEKKSKKRSKDRNKKQSKSSQKSKLETCPASNQPASSHEVRKVEATKGAIAVTSEETIRSNGYVIQANKHFFQSEYSQVFRAQNKSIDDQLVVKMINLTECSPRLRTNLLQTATRIMRFTGGGDQLESQPICSLFIKIYELFVIGGAKMLVFMSACDSSRLMYDLVKSKDKQSHVHIRKWTKAIASGVDHLQRLGVAHRGIKLQHILLDRESNPKLCGWSKSVLYYDSHKKRILMQRKERRVRHNYYMPPEAFLGSYDPSKGDIWSIGIILVSLCTKRYPFNVRDGKTKFSSQWREFVKKHELNTFVRNLCHKLFIIDPKRRISSKTILKDKYFTVSEEKLAKINCTADLKTMREDSRVGGMSAIDFTSQQMDKSPAPKVKDSSKKTAAVQPEPEEAETEDQDYTQQATDDPSGVDENATGDEGGTVGAEEVAQEDESQMAENAAPEEAEGEAQPVEGEETVAEETQEEEEGEETETETEEGESEGDTDENEG